MFIQGNYDHIGTIEIGYIVIYNITYKMIEYSTIKPNHAAVLLLAVLQPKNQRLTYEHKLRLLSNDILEYIITMEQAHLG